MVYKGIVRGKIVELQGDVRLADGTEVDIVVRQPAGSPEAVLTFLRRPRHCTPDDVDALEKTIREGRRPTEFSDVFDSERKPRFASRATRHEGVST